MTVSGILERPVKPDEDGRGNGNDGCGNGVNAWM
jgi:hypothetical protein